MQRNNDNLILQDSENDRENFSSIHSCLGENGKGSKKSKRNEPQSYNQQEDVFVNNYEQEYERIIENERLLKSLVNPKRDKVIVQSLNHAKNERRNTSHIFCRTQCTFPKKRIKIKGKSSQSMKNYEEYSLKVENLRMGNRIINTRSTGYNLLLKDRIKKNYKKQQQKINQGVSAFIRRIPYQRQLPQNIGFVKPIYGMGPTIISISNIILNINPSIKNDDLISLELISNPLNSKLYTTQPIPYGSLQKIKIKFAVKIGDFPKQTPLRFCKIQQVKSVELGIVDLPFSHYQNKYESNDENEFSFIQNINTKGKKRIILCENIKTRLRRLKYEEAHGNIELNCMMYGKKYI